MEAEATVVISTVTRTTTTATRTTTGGRASRRGPVEEKWEPGLGELLEPTHTEKLRARSENWLGLNILRKLARSQYFEKCAQKPGGSLNAALKVEAFDANLMFSQTQTQ